MRKDDSSDCTDPTDQLRAIGAQGQAFPEPLLALLEARAEQYDNQLNVSLLNELVLKYALAERGLAALNRLKNKFLGIAAHDLRNPLSSIGGFAELLLDEDADPLTDEQRECLGMILGVSRDMLALVNDLLDVSVIESGKLDLNIEEGSLVEVLQERVRINRITAEKKKIQIFASLEEISGALFDAKRICQVIDNLITNAVKFSQPGSKVYVALVREGERVRVSVRDEGPGISEEDRAKLFGDFQKLSARPTGDERSTGLGLAIVKKIVEAHGATVQVESRMGEGSTFSFTLPSSV